VGLQAGRRARVILCALALVVAAASGGCGREAASGPPTIAFETVPPAAIGGSDRVSPIAGRVTGARPGQRIVLFAKSGVWWVQPDTAQPFTTIAADRMWRNTTHLGSEYAALLVDAAYRPPATVEVLPKPGGPIMATATVKGTSTGPPRPVKRLAFSGYQWDVRETPSDRGGANEFDAANAWVDEAGRLHLTLAKREGRWTGAEIVLTRTLGYGTYVFTVGDTAGLDPAATLGLFTWDDEGASQNHRELDVEIGQWGDRSIPNAQYVVQPYYVPANVSRFEAPAGVLTHSFRWEPERASFATIRGRGPHGRAADVVARHEFTSGVPVPGGERVRMSLYYFRYAPAAPQKDVEVVVERFQHLP
jgi:hypothetical protein